MPGAVNILNPFDKDYPAVHPGESAQRQWPWVNVGSMTVAEAAVSSAERSQTNMETTFVAAGKACIYSPKNGQVAATFRFRTDGDEDDSNVLDVFWACDDIVVNSRQYSRIGRLTILQGTQVYTAGIEYNDSITESLLKWISDTRVVQPAAADNHIAQWVINMHGVKKFAFVLITKDASTTTVYVDARRM